MALPYNVVMNDPLRTIDFFAGIGGIRLGFENAGFETVFASDSDAHCKITYEKNFGEGSLSVTDIRELSADPGQLPEFDVLLAGFPCQPFSVAGQKEGFKDEHRGNLFFDLIKIIDAHKPQAVFLENVKHLRNHDNGRTYPIIKESLETLGYKVKEEVLNSADFGNVPQNRERIYIVAFRSQDAYDAFRFPAPKPRTKKISDILDPAADERYYYRSGWLYDRVKGKVAEEGRVYQWRRVYLRENKGGLSFTLTANMGMGGHNVPLVRDVEGGIRRLTPRECARLQGFRESYKLPAPEEIAESHLYKQIGNSVTVSVVSRIAANIKRALAKDGTLGASGTKYGRRILKTEEERDNVSNPRYRYGARKAGVPAS
jgi:DNA (cytosine-5)-methyltransferase 1